MEGGAIVVGMYGRIEEPISNEKEKSSILLKEKREREKEGKNEERTKRKKTHRCHSHALDPGLCVLREI